MSHHFDMPSGLEDPRLNLCDFYLFAGRPGSTVMAMTVNPEADALQAPLFREEGLYVFRFDGNGDGHDDVSFKVRFGEATHSDDGGHEQTFEVRRATGEAASRGTDGALMTSGKTSESISGTSGVTVFAGQVQDAFAGNAAGMQGFRTAMAGGEYKPESFDSRENFFAPRQVAAIVLEVPNEMIGDGTVHGWATVSLHGHAPEQQVARWGLPLFTHLFLSDEKVRDSFNRSAPSGDNEPYRGHVAAVIQGTTSLAGTAANPEAYAARVVDRFGHFTLPYNLGSQASFDFAGFNGRAMHDGVMDVMLSLMTNSPVSNGAALDLDRIADKFPYFTPTTKNA